MTVNTPQDGWMLGSCNGRRGFFPASYVRLDGPPASGGGPEDEGASAFTTTGSFTTLASVPSEVLRAGEIGAGLRGQLMSPAGQAAASAAGDTLQSPTVGPWDSISNTGGNVSAAEPSATLPRGAARPTTGSPVESPPAGGLGSEMASPRGGAPPEFLRLKVILQSL